LNVRLTNLHSGIEFFPGKILKAARRALGLKSCDIIVVDRKFIRGLNLRFSGKDKPTDVLAFDSRDPSDKSRVENFIGDVFICSDIAREHIDSVLHGRRKALLKKPTRKELITNELCLYAVHGILHLLGYSDKTPKAKKGMFKIQEEILIQKG
jgi:probable rRNA maturation factor